MAKRGLCLLLALATVFSLAAPALAEGETVTTEEAVVTEAPVVTEEPVAVTEEPVDKPVPAAVIASGTCGVGVNWSISGTTLTISGTGAMENRNSSLWSNYYVENAVIGDGVTSIGDHAFENCTSLTDVTLPESVTSIGESAFAWCTSLTMASLPAVTSVGQRAFAGTAIQEIDLSSVKEIAENTFESCKKLMGVVLSDDLTSVGARAFQNCERLTSLELPETVTSIGAGALNGCSQLRRINIPKGITRIESGMFQGCQRLSELTLPEGLTYIGERAFYGTGITKLNIPKGVTYIGGYAFSGTGIKTFAIPGKVTIIQECTFSGCTALQSVTVPGSVTTIEDWAFEGCANLAGISLPDSVTTIGKQAFDGCQKLAAMKIPQKVSSIGPNAFAGCAVTDVTVPGNVTSIGGSAFGNGAVEDIYIENPDCVIEEPIARDEPVARKNQSAKAASAPALGGTLGTPGTTVVHGHIGSTAEAHAKAHGYEFIDINIVVTPSPEPTAEPTPVPTAEPTPVPTATPKPQLAAPTVKIEKVSTGIKVSWNKVTGSPRYMVYYKEGNGSWKKIGTTTSTTYTRKAANLKSGVTYTFTVRCCANDKKTLLGPYKASNSLKYTAQLAAPTVKVAKVSTGIKVSWNKIAGSPRYMVYYKENNGGWKKIGTTTSTTYTRAAKYLKNNVTYTFTVRCCANDKKTLLGPYKASNSLKYKK